MSENKPCIACLIRPRRADLYHTHFCQDCKAVWVKSPEPITHEGVAEFAIRRREEVLKPVEVKPE